MSDQKQSYDEVTVRLHPDVLKWLDSFVHNETNKQLGRSEAAKCAILSAYNRHLIEARAEALKVPISTAYAMLSPFGLTNGITVRQCFLLLDQLGKAKPKEKVYSCLDSNKWSLGECLYEGVSD